MHKPQWTALLAVTCVLAGTLQEAFSSMERAKGQMRLEEPAVLQALQSLDRPKSTGIRQNAFGEKGKSDLPWDFYEPCQDEMARLTKTRARVDNELLRRARMDKRLRVRYRAARILAQRGNEQVIPILLQMTTSADADERYLGWNLYSSALLDRTLPRPQDIGDALLRYGRETDAAVRVEIESFFAKARNAAAVKPLLQRVRKDPGATTAIWALGEIGDPAAVPRIIEAYKDSEYLYRDVHLEALGKLATPEAVDFLIEHLDAHGASEALGKTKSAKALPALRAHLKKLEAKSSKEPEGALTHTRIALVKLSHKDPREPLLALAENPRESVSLRSHAIYTLRSHDCARLEPRILSLYKNERKDEVKCSCVWLLENSELKGVTEAMTEHALRAEGPLECYILLEALNKRLGTSFRSLEALQSHLRAMKKRPGGR